MEGECWERSNWRKVVSIQLFWAQVPFSYVEFSSDSSVSGQQAGRKQTACRLPREMLGQFVVAYILLAHIPLSWIHFRSLLTSGETEIWSVFMLRSKRKCLNCSLCLICSSGPQICFSLPSREHPKKNPRFLPVAAAIIKSGISRW